MGAAHSTMDPSVPIILQLRFDPQAQHISTVFQLTFEL